MSITALTAHQVDQLNQDSELFRQIQVGTKLDEIQDMITGSAAEVETLTNKTLVAPKIATGGIIADAGGDEYIKFVEDATPVTYIQVTSGDTTVAPKVQGAGETNTDLHLLGFGTGNVKISDATDETKLAVIELVGAATNTKTTFAISQTADRIITMPDATDTLVGKATADTMTNKTLTSPILQTAPKVLNDSPLSMGTTLTNDATKMTLEFDATTSGIGLFNSGTADNPHVLNADPGATVKARSLALLHSAGAGNCDDLILDYKRAWVKGAGDAGMTVVGDAPRVYVGETGGANNSVASAAYASQPWAKHEGTGAITAMSALSALVDVNADAFTANTVNAGHFHIEGAAAVTAQFDGVVIEAYPDVTCLDSLLALAVDTGAVVGSIIRVSGESTTFIDVAAETAAVVVAAGSTIHHDPNAVTSDAYMVVKIGAIEYAMPLYVLHA